MDSPLVGWRLHSDAGLPRPAGRARGLDSWSTCKCWLPLCLSLWHNLCCLLCTAQKTFITPTGQLRMLGEGQVLFHDIDTWFRC